MDKTQRISAIKPNEDYKTPDDVGINIVGGTSNIYLPSNIGVVKMDTNIEQDGYNWVMMV